jgi:hypothetical protein
LAGDPDFSEHCVKILNSMKEDFYKRQLLL